MKNLNFLKTWKFAHRGLHNISKGIPENSETSFTEAIKNGYGIELDIRLTKDKKYVCFHDQSLKRMAGINKNVNEYSYDELKIINLLDSNETIPLFTDILKIVNSKVPLLIEVKSEKNFKTDLHNFVKIMDSYKGEFAVFSFDPKIVMWFKKNKPSFIRGQITSYFHENDKMPRFVKFLMKKLVSNSLTKPDFISYNLDNLPNKYANKAKKQGLTVISYTARTQAQYDNVLLYYDNVVFENFIPKNIKK